jgi:SAM-dependent methyltransferase
MQTILSGQRLDSLLLRFGGLTYARIVRDPSIHDRCEYLIDVIRSEIGHPVSVLDVGCGGGFTLFHLSRARLVSRYLGLDFNVERLRPRYEHISVPHEFKNLDLDTNWDFGEHDVVWCSETLEHLIDDSGVFAKICRATKPSGLIVVTMPSLTHRRRLGKSFPEFLAVSANQDGRSHVRIGYDETSLKSLAAGTRAQLMRIDAISRCDIAYYRRRYLWPAAAQIIHNIWVTMRQTPSDRFIFAPDDFSQHQSIAAVYCT